jgi:BRCT domain type II-containing protein
MVGKLSSSISAKTDYVVTGDNMEPNKLDKTTKLKLYYF